MLRAQAFVRARRVVATWAALCLFLLPLLPPEHRHVDPDGDHAVVVHRHAMESHAVGAAGHGPSFEDRDDTASVDEEAAIVRAGAPPVGAIVLLAVVMLAGLVPPPSPRLSRPLDSPERSSYHDPPRYLFFLRAPPV